VVQGSQQAGGARWLAGALAGLVAGVLFGAVVPAEEMMPMIAALYGLESVTAGWVVHLIHSAVFGLVFVAIGRIAALRRYTDDPAAAAIPGAVFGLLLWVVAASLVMPVWIRAVTEMAPPVPDWNLLSLVGHLVYGVTLGLVCATVSVAAAMQRRRAPAA
jgi:uncharacterized membrane protein YagU involved in acid resistance